MRTRSLRLAKETLTPLGNAELAAVAGGARTLPCIECNYTYCPDCINDWTFEFCPSLTLPLEHCV